MHGYTHVYEFTYVCDIVCVYMEGELSYRVLGERNLEKWSKGWCWVFSKRLRLRRPGDRVSVSVPLCFKKEAGKSPGMSWVAVLPEHLVF